jgi:hypothetical protein
MEAAGVGCTRGFDNSPTRSVAATPRNIPGLLAAELTAKQMFGGARRNSVQLLLGDAFLDYAPSTQMPSLHARKDYAALVRCGGTVRSPEDMPSAKETDRVRSPDYTPVSRFWTSGGPTVSTTCDDQGTGAWSPGVAPASIHPRATSPDYTPRARSARATPRHGAGAPRAIPSCLPGSILF